MFSIKESSSKVKPGDKFNYLTVLGWQFRAHRDKLKWWVVCQCDCGSILAVQTSSLTVKTTPTISCGCSKGANQSRASEHACLYYIWRAIRGRCFNQKNHNYQRYAARGITMCAEWRDSFDAFKTWALANGYQRGLSIDRKDNDGSYTPENCQWLTRGENSRKRGQDNREKKQRLTAKVA